MKAINKDFMYMRPARLTIFGVTVEGCVARHPEFFPSPEPSLLSIAETRIELSAAISKAVNGGLVDRQNRNKLYELYKGKILALSQYVTLAAGINENALSLSGFNITRTRQRIGVPEAVTSVQFNRRQQDGQVQFRWKPTRGAKSYCIVFKKENDVVEYVQVSTCAKAIVRVPNPGAMYYFKIAAVSTKGQGPWSEEVKLFVV